MSTVKTDASDVSNWYVSTFNTFESGLNGSASSPFSQVRKDAIQRFSEMGFPTRRDEEWKYTPVNPILKHKFAISQPGSLTLEQVHSLAFQALRENVIVLVNGRFDKKRSNFRVPKGVIVESLAGAIKHRPELITRHLARFADYSGEAFTALNTAFVDDGVFIHIPDNVVLETPVHVLYISDARKGGFYANPRNLVVAGRNARGKIVEKYVSTSPDAVYFNNGVTEVFLDQGARIDHVRVQDESLNAFHVKNLQACQSSGSNYTLVNIDMGGRLVRNNFNMKLDEPNCEGHLIGAYLATGNQHVDNHTAIDHAKPNCFSNEIYKGILGGKSRGVFNGKIFVRQDAQKTNAFQDNKALLLTNDAMVYTKPQLEIFADDVKCSHGATIGQLDEESLFYLRSRGIPEDAAYSMLQYAFVSEILDYVTVDEIKEELDQMLLEHFRKL